MVAGVVGFRFDRLLRCRRFHEVHEVVVVLAIMSQTVSLCGHPRFHVVYKKRCWELGWVVPSFPQLVAQNEVHGRCREVAFDLSR